MAPSFCLDLLSNVKCHMCKSVFSEDNKPILIPYCGHVLCPPCKEKTPIVTEKKTRKMFFKCPVCSQYEYLNQVQVDRNVLEIAIELARIQSSVKDLKMCPDCYIERDATMAAICTNAVCKKKDAWEMCIKCHTTSHPKHTFRMVDRASEESDRQKKAQSAATKLAEKKRRAEEKMKMEMKRKAEKKMKKEKKRKESDHGKKAKSQVTKVIEKRKMMTENKLSSEPIAKRTKSCNKIQPVAISNIIVT